MQNSILENGVNVHISPSSIDTTLDKIQFEYDVLVAQGQNHLSKKIGGYTVSLNHKNTLSAAEKAIQSALALGYDQLLEDQKKLGQKIGRCLTSRRRRKSTAKEFVLISFNSTKPI
jgi:maltose phosphorylase